jgi:TP901 family phage tail tape measure protein
LSINAAQLVVDVSAASGAQVDAQLLALGASADATAAAFIGTGSSAGILEAYLTSLGISTDVISASLDVLAASANGTASALMAPPPPLIDIAASADKAALSLKATSVSLKGAGALAESAAVKFDALGLSEKALAASTDFLLGSLKALAISLGVISLVAGVVGIVSAKMAGDFQSSMTLLVTGAGELQSNLKLVSDGILAMAPAVGESTKELAAGMFMIESSGQHGKQALLTLKDVAMGAKVGMASLADVANGVTTEMTDYAASHLTAAQATNTLIAAVSLGKTHMQDLANAMSTILPTSAAVHVSLTDTAAAMATMTAEGTDAASAATYLKQLLIALEAPSSKAASTLREVGLSAADVSTEMSKSLPGTLQMITDALKKKFPEGSAAYVEALKNIAGGSRQMQGILELTGSHLETFKNDVKGVSDAVNKGGDSIVGWNLVQDDFNQKVDQAKAGLETLFIKIGTAFLPILGQMFDGITNNLSAFTSWTDKSHILEDAAKTLSGWIGYVGDAFNQVFVRGSNMIDTFDRATSIIKPLNGVMGPLVDTFDRASGVFTNKLIPAVKPFLDTFDRASGVVHNLTGAVGDMNAKVGTGPNVWIPFWAEIKHVRDQIMGIDWAAVGKGMDNIRVAISKMDWGKVGAFFSNIADAISRVDWTKVGKAVENIAISFTKVDWGKVGVAIAGIATALISVDWKKTGQGVSDLVGALTKVDWKGIQGSIEGVVGAIKALASWWGWIQGNLLGGNAGNVISGAQNFVKSLHLPGFASGIENFGGGLAYVHSGEVLTYLPPGTSVTPANKVAAMSGNNQQIIVQPTPIYLDGRLLTNGMMPHFANAVRANLGGFA